MEPRFNILDGCKLALKSEIFHTTWSNYRGVIKKAEKYFIKYIETQTIGFTISSGEPTVQLNYYTGGLLSSPVYFSSSSCRQGPWADHACRVPSRLSRSTRWYQMYREFMKQFTAVFITYYFLVPLIVCRRLLEMKYILYRRALIKLREIR